MNEKLYPELIYEEILNKKLRGVNSFFNSINNFNFVSRFYEEK